MFRLSMLGNRTRRFKRTFLSNIYNFRYSRKEKSMMIIMENDLKKETTKLKSYIYIIIDIYNFI